MNQSTKQCLKPLLFLLAALGGFSLARAEPIPVFVSVLPQKYFVERVGGDRVSVNVMVGPGQNPHIYEPMPKQMAQLAKAKIYYRIGVSFETVWMEHIKAANPAMRIIDCQEGIELHPMARAEELFSSDSIEKISSQGGHRHGRLDPHSWTSPPLVKIIAAHIRDSLIQADPAHQAEFQTHYARLAEDLDRLDQTIRQLLAPLRGKSFMTFHPSWGYFAATYGLKQIPIEIEGKEPGAKTLARLIELAERENSRVILVQQQFSRRLAETVARAIGAKVMIADPLAYDYSRNLRQVAEALAQAMR